MQRSRGNVKPHTGMLPMMLPGCCRDDVTIQRLRAQHAECACRYKCVQVTQIQAVQKVPQGIQLVRPRDSCSVSATIFLLTATSSSCRSDFPDRFDPTDQFSSVLERINQNFAELPNARRRLVPHIWFHLFLASRILIDLASRGGGTWLRNGEGGARGHQKPALPWT